MTDLRREVACRGRGTAPLVVDDPFDVTWRERALVLGSLAVLLVVGGALGATYARAETLELLGVIPVALFAVGKFLPLWGVSEHSSFGPYALGLVVWILDTVSVIAIVYGLEGLYRVRPLQRALDRVQTNAGLVLAAYPRMRRAAVVGIVLFVLFPIAGTGAVGATFLGILLGLHRGVLIGAVSLGGCLGGFIMAFAAVHFANAAHALQIMQRDPAVKYLLLALIATAVGGALWLLNRAYKRALSGARNAAALAED